MREAFVMMFIFLPLCHLPSVICSVVGLAATYFASAGTVEYALLISFSMNAK
jgi:hypothetical protein